MKIVWLDRGNKSLAEHIRHIHNDNPQAALKMAKLIDTSVKALEMFPYTGRTGRISGTRELVVAPYVIAYRVKKDIVEIMHVLHGAQDWPDKFQ